MTKALIKQTDRTPHPEDVKRTLQHSSVPCKDVIELRQQGKERGKRLTNLEKKVEEGFILIFDALGIREKTNGERKKQIQEALTKISEVKEETETENKSLRDILVEMQIEQAEIKGFIKGQDKRELQHDKQEAKVERETTRKWDRIDKYIIASLGIIVTVCIFIAGLSI
jgi:hypothetical protein